MYFYRPSKQRNIIPLSLCCRPPSFSDLDPFNLQWTPAISGMWGPYSLRRWPSRPIKTGPRACHFGPLDCDVGPLIYRKSALLLSMYTPHLTVRALYASVFPITKKCKFSQLLLHILPNIIFWSLKRAMQVPLRCNKCPYAWKAVTPWSVISHCVHYPCIAI